jgi:putative serine protease PepD
VSHDEPDEPTTPLPEQPPSSPPGPSSGPFSGPFSGASSVPSYAPPQHPAYQPPVPFPAPWGQQPDEFHDGWPGYPSSYGAPYPSQQDDQRTQAPAPGRVPAWLLPVVGLTALLLGIGGGALGAALVGSGSESGGLIGVQRREAAPLPDDNASVASVAQRVLPSTVQIVAEFDGDDQGATGSGFVLDGKGHVITNNHVVAQADEDDGPIDVIDREGHHYKASVVGRSTVYDIAVLRVPRARRLAPVALGSAAQMRVGETVVAIGSPLGLSATVTSGIISAVDRPVTTGEGANDNSYINALQTDAAINPGNSGGPLVNLQGQVVGVNSAIASLGSQITSDQGGSIGVGFAIPIEQVEVTTTQILRTGKAQYPVIGANVRATTKRDGATVESIVPGAPAADAELEVGDVIRKVDGKPVTGSIDLVVAIRTHVPGEKVTLQVQRGGRTFEVKVGLDAKTG